MNNDTIKRINALEAISGSCKTCLASSIGYCDRCSVTELRKLINAIPPADKPQNERLEEALEWTCKYASEYKVDIDIHIEANGEIAISVTPTYRDIAETAGGHTND